MALSKVEKLMLSNQYEILKRLAPGDSPHYDNLLRCLSSGYERDFFELAGYFDESTSPEVMSEVREILDMFRALTPPKRTGIEATARFVGFDANEEGSHYGYACFLIEDRELWPESKRAEGYNTHSLMLPGYRRMLAHWHKAKHKFELTAEEIEEITAVAPRAALP